MANTDFIQATIEIFGAAITILVAVVFVIITRIEKKSEKNLFALLVASALALLFDAGWYMFDGNTSTFGFFANWFSNLAIFLCNPIMVLFVTRYVRNFLIEDGQRLNKVLLSIAYLMSGITFCMPISNLFYHWMYDFDAANVYYRMFGWYVYTIANVLTIAVAGILLVVHRQHLSVRKRIAFMVFFLAPFVSIGLQMLVDGISFVQIGTGLGGIFIVASYLMEWIHVERGDEAISEDQKKVWIIECAFGMMIMFISAAIFTCAVSVNTVSNENSVQNSTALAFMVSETVEDTLDEPINVAKTMAQSEIMRQAMLTEEIEGSDTEAHLLAFMQRIKQAYAYQSVFVACEQNKAYYTHDGFSRYMDLEEDGFDFWYTEFSERDTTMELNIDYDKDDNMSLAVFVNMKVFDDDGQCIGVCGVSMSIESLMEMLSAYEDTYDISISLVNQVGLVQVNTDRDKIENAYCDITPLMYQDNISPQAISYDRDDDQAILIKHVGEYDWYMYIEDYNPDKLNVFRIILPSMIIYIIGVVFMLVFSLVFGMRERRRSKELRVTKQQSETAKAESEAKGKFLANMSHEIRTPINAVLGMDTMILRESREPQIREYAMIIQNSANILLALINDILDISKIESGKMEIVPVQYDVSVLISDVMNMVSLKAEKKGLDVQLEIDQSLPSGLIGDDVRLRQIILNLMNNAVKYTEKGSVTMCVTGDVEDDTLRLKVVVKDTGIGIKEEDMHKLFEDFVRIEESRNKNIEGTGLGMSITMQLLKLMNSKLDVTSVYGEGSAFSFVVDQQIVDASPVGDVAMHIRQKAEDFAYQSSFQAPDARVLVVDDNEVNHIVFGNLLKETLVQIDHAGGGLEALDKIHETPYDIIFLDHMMPDLDGIEVLHRVKASDDHPNAETPVIVLTANAISGSREMYLEAGFKDYLTKPIIAENLEKMISQYLTSDKIVVGDRMTLQERKEDLSIELPMVDGVDWNYAKMHLSDPQGLMATLRSFVTSIASEAAQLSAYYDKLMADETDTATLDLYRIKVHGMKSTANLIGCVPCAGMAATLEMAAKDGQMDLIRDVTPHFIKEWSAYKDKLSFALEPEGDKQDVDDMGLIVDYLTQLKDAAAVFDVEGADAAMSTLSQYQYEDAMASLMEQVAVAVNNLDVDEVTRLCDEMIQMVQ